MPANRSRTGRWRDCLWQVYERAGALEISVDPGRASGAPVRPDLVWRVRITGMSDSVIEVEQPSAAGQVIPIRPGVRLIAAMSIGQNRWMFHTRALSAEGGGGRGGALRLEMPSNVERCQRRNFFRTSTAELSLPRVECWPLLDPSSALAAEVANRAQIVECLRGGGASDFSGRAGEEPLVLPDVGPKFHGHLMNLGGGGAGLLVDRADAASLDRSRFFWLRIDLTPEIPLPLGITGRLVHTHIDSSQNFYIGIAFDWSFNAGHRDFVVEQIAGYLGALQHRQKVAA